MSDSKSVIYIELVDEPSEAPSRNPTDFGSSAGPSYNGLNPIPEKHQ